MEKLPGLLSLDSTPSGVTVEIDGQPVGLTPLVALEVTMGRHEVKFSHPRYFPLTKSMDIVGAGEKQQLTVTLEPAWARITINSKPQGAKLFVDGKEIGITPMVFEPVAGNHKIRLQQEKFTDFNTDFLVTAGEKRTLPTFQLIPAPGRLILSSEPDKVSVSVDAVFQGKTPLTLSLAAGVSHVIDLMAPGFKAVRKKIILQAAEEQALTINLVQESGTVFLSCFPAEATLYVDGKKQGSATTSLRLASRPHTLEIRASGYEKWRQRITPQAGISQRLEVHLKRKTTAADNKNSEPTATIQTIAGQKMVLIHPSPFIMGASRGEPGRRANEREHKVVLQRPFYLAVKEVTNAEFRLFMPDHTSGSVANRSLENNDMPVVNVTWDEATRYLNQLSKKEGLPPFYHEENGKMRANDKAGTGYRLPTEAEWAYVARIADRPGPARYPWPGSFPPTSTVANFADESARHIVAQIINGYNDSFPALAPVAGFAPGPMGFYDMAGNAAEWCHDFYTANPGLSRQQSPDPLGPESGTHHLVRGSSWRDGGITELRFSYRRYSRQATDDIGFRFARYAR
jgi:formylglycine-generating enzyme required for sulfatase activity